MKKNVIIVIIYPLFGGKLYIQAPDVAAKFKYVFGNFLKDTH